MKSTLEFGGRVLYNPTKKIISSILRKHSAYYRISLYLMKTRISPDIIHQLYSHGTYRTSYGDNLILRKDMVYLIAEGNVRSLGDVSKLEKRIENSKQEVLIHYPTYPEYIKNIDMFNKMLGKAWKKS